MARKVCVIGAGVGGLTSVKHLLDEGLEVECFEQRSWIGGLWNYTEEKSSKFAVAPRATICNISKQMMSFSDFPVPLQFPNFMPVDVYQKYLEMYAEKFNLLDKITFNCTVVDLRPAPDYEQTGMWVVTREVNGDHDGIQRSVQVFDAVMICCGIYWNRFIPDIPGKKDFQGEQIHAASYRDWRGFEGKRVVVVGLGNSGGDIAVELSKHASQVYFSTRTGAWIISRMGPDGWPGDHRGLCRAVRCIPFELKNWLIESELNRWFNHANFGLQSKKTPLRLKFTVNDELPHRILTSAIIMKSKLSRLTERSAIFEDGTEIDDVDCILFTTGFNFKIWFLSEDIIKVDEQTKFTPLYRLVFPPDLPHPTLALIGFGGANGPAGPVLEMQARWVSKVFVKECFLPPKDTMHKEIKEKSEFCRQLYGADTTEFLRVIDLIGYLDQVAADIGCRPNLWQLLLTDPKLALRCFFGPCLPFQYRLVGPGSWDGAKAAIEDVPKSVIIPTRTREIQIERKTGQAYWVTGPILCLIIGLVILHWVLF